jgi:hypothetical protein
MRMSVAYSLAKMLEGKSKVVFKFRSGSVFDFDGVCQIARLLKNLTPDIFEAKLKAADLISAAFSFA